ncbi:MAG: hotdog fold thioesterase [Spirochaetia bacterium]|nr:hotdog fold thioesterase [Spirochaetia bacterium]
MKADKFVDLCGITLDEIGPGYAKTSVEIQPQHLNGAGIIQGGVLFTLADYALASAANSREKVSVSIETSMSFIKGVSTGKVFAVAKEVSCGRTLARYNVPVTTEDGTLIALLHGTVYRK